MLGGLGKRLGVSRGGIDLNPAEVRPAVIYDDATAAAGRPWEFVSASEKEALAARRRARSPLRRRLRVWWAMLFSGDDDEQVEYLTRWLPTVELSLACKVLLGLHSFWVMGFCVGAFGLDTSARMDLLSVLTHGAVAAVTYVWSC